MRLQFDEGDERAAATARERLVELFGAWLGTHPGHDRAEAWDADLLLHWKWAYADGDYGRWARSDVDEFLPEHLPRKLSASPPEAASVPSSVGAFVEFLDEQGLLDERSDRTDDIAQRALALERSFLDAMVDP